MVTDANLTPAAPAPASSLAVAVGGPASSTTDPDHEGRAPSAGGRLDGLDRLRGAALLLMLFHHLTDWFGPDARSVIPGWESFAVTDVAAPAFTIALGASVPLLLDSRRRRGRHGAALAGTVLRRYGLLVPIGLGLRAAIGFDLDHTGVLETLGMCALVTAVVVTVTSGWRRVFVTSVVLVASPAVETWATDRTDWLSTHVLTGTFPLATYVALALVGAVVVPALRSGRARPVAAVVAAIGSAATVAMLLAGSEPDRYPGGPAFLVPGLAGTALLFLAVTAPGWSPSGRGHGIVSRAGAHTFGVFLSHYLVYVALRSTGNLHALPAPVAVTAAAVTAVAFAALAPRVPELPWSPRTGWATPRVTARRG